MDIILTARENIHRQGSEQQPRRSECHSSCRYEPLVDSRSCPDETEDVFLRR